MDPIESFWDRMSFYCGEMRNLRGGKISSKFQMQNGLAKLKRSLVLSGLP